MGEEPVRKGQADQTAVGMAGKHQICPQLAVLTGKAVVPVGQQHPEGIAAGGVDLRRQLLRRFLIGVAVGIVNAGQYHGVPIALQRDKLIGEHGHPVGGEGLLQLRDVADGPLVVAGDIIRGGDGAQTVRQLGHIFRFPPPVLIFQIPQKENIVRFLFRHGAEKRLVLRAEAGTVEIAEHSDAAAVKPCRQIGK